MLERLGTIHEKYSRFARKTNPDIYSANDAASALFRIKDRSYALGSKDVDPKLNHDRAKIWSLPPEILEEVREIIRNSGHIHALPFIMGTYNMHSQTMRMNDISVSDPYMLSLMATGGLEGFTAPILRGLYFFGRRNWWRHESIHARHHHQMAHFLEASDQKKVHGDRSWKDRSRMEEAAYTIHEAGIEELLTRFQALKESRGKKEAISASIALLLYLEYTPFTGLRNLLIDTKEKTYDLLKDGRIRIPAKIVTTVGVVALPFWLDSQTQWVNHMGETLSGVTPFSNKQLSSLIYRGLGYVDISVISAMFSTKEKGALQKDKADGQHMPTSEYKFPYAYSPVTSIGRSLDFIFYLQRVWEQIPHYRLVSSRAGIERVKGEIDDRASKMGEREHHFTMQVIEDALRPIESATRSSFPRDVYIKGLFIPAMYINLRDKYTTPSPESGQK